MPVSMSEINNLRKAFILKLVDDKIKSSYTFTLNFSDLSRSNIAEYNFISPPGSMLPTAIYKSSPGGEITFSVMIDMTKMQNKGLVIFEGTEVGLDNLGIESHLAFFESLTLPDADTFLASRSRWTAPPRLILGVGDRTWNVVCTNTTQRETSHTRQLAPFRAMVDVTLKHIFTGESDMLSYMTRVQSRCVDVET